MADSNSERSKPAQRGFIGRKVHSVVVAFFWLLLSLLISIVIEWIGMNTAWEDEGLKHSQEMLQTELNYLNKDFKKSLLVSSPVLFAKSAAVKARKILFGNTGIDQASVRILRNENSPWILEGVARHALAAANITQVFAARLAILFMALPVFAIFAVVAIVDGLVQRDIRRWAFGRERAGVYHYAKRLVPFFLFAPWVLYLALPESVHPNLVILPFAILFGIGLHLVAYLYKKHI